MTASLKTFFARKTGAALTAAAALCGSPAAGATEAGHGLDARTKDLLGQYPVCIKTGQLQSIQPWQTAESYIVKLVRQAELVIDADDADTTICTNPNMPFKVDGEYDTRKNLVSITYPTKRNATGIPRGEETMILSLRHEWRHRMQNGNGFTKMLLDTNIPANDRFSLLLAEEADARVEGVVFADRMRRKGKPEYVADMMRDSSRIPMSAYMRAIRSNSRNPAEAMRAAFAGFYSNVGSVEHYCRSNAAVIYDDPENPPSYEQGKSPAVSNETLTRLGERPGQASYIDETLREIIRFGCRLY